jgi:hypothetical protein
VLTVMLRIAAYDKRITDQTWRGLDAGRKEILLPLGDDRKLREAASHVSKFNLALALLQRVRGVRQAFDLRHPDVLALLRRHHERHETSCCHQRRKWLGSALGSPQP